MVAWLLLVFGITLVITKAKAAAPLRWLFSFHKTTVHFIQCTMCVGWWTGFFLSRFSPHLGLVTLETNPLLQAFANAFCSTAACWIIHVILTKLGAETL